MARKRNTKRSDGRYAVQVYLGLVDGKRKYKTVYGATQKEADEKAVEIKLSLKKGIDVTSENDTFCLWAERFLSLKESEVSNGQYYAYKSFCQHLNQNIGHMPIIKIKTADLQRIFTDFAKNNPNTNKPASKKFLVGLKQTTNQIFQLAINNRLMDYNPVGAVIIPRTVEPERRRALTDAEQQWIINTPHRAQLPAMIMMYAGLRRGELLALTWSDIDLKNSTIRVNKAVEYIKGTPCVKPKTKTAAGMRIVDIPYPLVNFLEKQPRNNLLVCLSAHNTIMTSTAWNKMWKSYICDLNLKYGGFPAETKKYSPEKLPIVIPRFTAHWLRHTFASLLYMAGVDVLTAKDQLGHADIKTTLNIYTHLDVQFKRRSMSKVNTYLLEKCQQTAIEK